MTSNLYLLSPKLAKEIDEHTATIEAILSDSSVCDLFRLNCPILTDFFCSNAKKLLYVSFSRERTVISDTAFNILTSGHIKLLQEILRNDLINQVIIEVLTEFPKERPTDLQLSRIADVISTIFANDMSHFQEFLPKEKDIKNKKKPKFLSKREKIKPKKSKQKCFSFEFLYILLKYVDNVNIAFLFRLLFSRNVNLVVLQNILLSMKFMQNISNELFHAQYAPSSADILDNFEGGEQNVILSETKNKPKDETESKQQETNSEREINPINIKSNEGNKITDKENEANKIITENEADKTIDKENDENKIITDNEESKILDNENEKNKTIDNENEGNKIITENEVSKILYNENEANKAITENEENKTIDNENEADKITDNENEGNKIITENEGNKINDNGKSTQNDYPSDAPHDHTSSLHPECHISSTSSLPSIYPYLFNSTFMRMESLYKILNSASMNPVFQVSFSDPEIYGCLLQRLEVPYFVIDAQWQAIYNVILHLPQKTTKYFIEPATSMFDSIPRHVHVHHCFALKTLAVLINDERKKYISQHFLSTVLATFIKFDTCSMLHESIRNFIFASLVIPELNIRVALVFAPILIVEAQLRQYGTVSSSAFPILNAIYNASLKLDDLREALQDIDGFDQFVESFLKKYQLLISNDYGGPINDKSQ